MFFRWFEHTQVYHPDRKMFATGAELGRPFEDITFKAEDGIELNGWFYPAEPGSARKDLAVLYCHGNAGNISTRLEICQALLETGPGVLLFDYRGYGRSEGRPSEAGTYLDAQAAYGWLLGKGFSPNGIVAFGESLGGAIATELATRVPLAGLVLESSFSCTADLGAELFPWLPVRRLSRIKYETCEKLPRVQIPLLILHSRSDELIGFQHAEKNFSRANQPKILCEVTGAHSEPLTDRAKFMDVFDRFLQLVDRKEPA